MSQETDWDFSSTIRADLGFRRLIQAVALGERFQLLIVISDSPPVIRKALQFLEEDASLVSRKPAKVVILDPYTASSKGSHGKLTETRLLDSVLSALVLPPFHAHSENSIVAIIGSGASTADEEAWRVLFRRMNERRNSIIRRVDGVILLCLTPSLYSTFAREAPDFWSIRNASSPVTAIFCRSPAMERSVCSRSLHSWNT